jgi:hypothetical protein
MKNIVLKISLFVFLLVASQAVAQSIVLDEEQAITDMMAKFKSEGQLSDQIRGWRIQIMTTDDRRKMEASRAKFTRMYPDTDIQWEHVRPYYKVKVGAWEDKRSLQVFLLEIKNDFPSAIPVMDDIKKAELVVQ